MYNVKADNSLILASASPRRSELLALSSLQFEIIVANHKEEVLPAESALQLVERLSLEKAQLVSRTNPAKWVIGADTVVSIDDKILGKPASPAEAASMLQSLAGRRHAVWGGFAIVNLEKSIAHVESYQSIVQFTQISEKQIQAYIASGEPMDKAGAYAIQGIAGQFVEKIDGSYSNIVGLNLCALLKSLLALGVIEVV